MVGEKLTQPKLNATGYHCPLCGVYAAQWWFKTFCEQDSGRGVRRLAPRIRISFCARCDEPAIWHDSRMVHPDAMVISPPNPDLDTDIQEDYREAASIVNRSPRAATALLRLCVQKLCKQLGQDGKNVNDDIAALVEAGLPEKIQQALDVLRVVGNNAVHPGQIDLTDNRALAIKLFDLLNLIAENQVTQPERIQAMYKDLPEGAKDSINERDGKQN